ncbi:HesA/MoeB/ThiF family protein [Methanosphaerula palustris]|uniref:UBA/THIF-type NAD/FAD binding protein n=1 Tax=Methanosphaerula palustris (strain ATCC BAA-1556 / DSM 19958 / E1-9c) TaxID=521011 RepID=B8GHP2_METPE|nr:HesA/MoeB/ThiF family protein [Methanosphaerula palustris]ACL16647.1 UBA/THIF-type NAD/FAD binding protein [Methanosphaerula palustris E1-9c]
MLIFDEDGQERLKQATIVIAGAGGLGSPVAVYCAAAGIGRIVLIDKDTVDLSNLNRQILHSTPDIGRRKVISAEEKLQALNPDIEVVAIHETIDAGNIGDLVGDADGIVDAMDNYPIRFLLNQTALSKGIPLFHGAIRGFHGQATTIVPGETPCLSCIFPHAPPKEVFPVVGVTPGIIGMIQAGEVIKYLTGTGTLLAGRLLLWDGLNSRTEEITVAANPHCEVCGSPQKE